MDELRPCPFCGGEAERYEDAGGYSVDCTACGAGIGYLGKGLPDAKGRAVAAWNRRTEGECHARLADLIEPAQDHIGDPDKMVDRGALLALADEIEGPECVMRCCNGAFAGIMFVALNHEHIARRIREACGEADG